VAQARDLERDVRHYDLIPEHVEAIDLPKLGSDLIPDVATELVQVMSLLARHKPPADKLL
jgi:hypothetical protein